MSYCGDRDVSLRGSISICQKELELEALKYQQLSQAYELLRNEGFLISSAMVVDLLPLDLSICKCRISWSREGFSVELDSIITHLIHTQCVLTVERDVPTPCAVPMGSESSPSCQSLNSLLKQLVQAQQCLIDYSIISSLLDDEETPNEFVLIDKSRNIDLLGVLYANIRETRWVGLTTNTTLVPATATQTTIVKNLRESFLNSTIDSRKKTSLTKYIS